MSFPNSPTSGTTHTIGDITWEWNGYAWEVIVSTIGGVSGPQGATGATGPRGTTGDKVGGFTISANGLLRYDILTWDDVVLFSGVAVGNVRGATGPTGSAGASAGVLSLNGLSGDVTLLGGTSISISSGPAGITISYTGAAGSGNTGNTGATGNPPGIPYSYQVYIVSPWSGPALGAISLRNDQAGATLIEISATDINSKDVTTYLESWDDSTNTHKGYLHIQNRLGTKYHVYGITGNSTIDEQYFIFNLIPSFTGGFTFASSESVYLFFSRSGNVGAQGPTGSSSSGGGAAGTKTYAVFTPLDNEPPASDYATIDTRNSISFLSFVGTTAESAIFRSVIPQGATFTSLSAILYYGTTGSTGNIVWCAQFEDMIGQTLNSDGFATAICATGPVGATFLSGLTLTTSNINGITSGDPYRVKIYRDGASANDTHIQDAQLFTVEIRGA
jgi:hypothetical protein